MTKKTLFQRVDYEKQIELQNRGEYMCGYLRNPKYHYHKFYGNCSLNHLKCSHYSLSRDDCFKHPTCEVYKDKVEKRV